MLKVSNISNIEIHTDDWRRERLGKFTSSNIFNLMGDKMLTLDGSAYIYTRVGEEMAGEPANEYVDTPETRHGILYEGEAIRKFMAWQKIQFMVVQKLIVIPGERYGSTPDGIIPIQKYDDQWDVETVEVKCYPSYTHYIKCVLCNTPQELKAVDKKLYWQVIDQMAMCDAMKGNAVLYHPKFSAGGFKVIPFRRVELIPDFKELGIRKILAVQKFDEIRAKLFEIDGQFKITA